MTMDLIKARAVPKAPRLSYAGEKRLVIVLFLLMPVGLLLLFSCYPAVKLIELSFTDWNGYSVEYGFVGLHNYLLVFKDAKILRAFANTFAYIVIAVVQTFLGLYLAIVLNTSLRGRNFFKSALFVPYVLNGVAVAFMFNYLYNYTTSPVNLILNKIGLGEYAIQWLSDSYFSNFSLAFIGMWSFTGLTMIIFIGALQSIPMELFEAADIDGASFGHKIRYIVYPSIKKIVELNLFLSLNGAFQAYFQAFVITKGGPAGATDTFVTSAIRTAFDYSNFGKASAMGVVLLVIVAVVTSLQKLFLRKGENE